MKRLLLMVGCALFLSGTAMGAGEKWSDVPLIDMMCALKVKDHSDGHTKACALQCAKGGFGIVADKGTILKFDDEGNGKVVASLRASNKADHLRVTVEGERQGDTIKVTRLQMQ